MQPKVGDKIITPNGYEWIVKEGQKPDLIDCIKKVRGTNEWRPLRTGDFIVTRGGLMRQVHSISIAMNRINYTSGTWDELKTVDYIAPNQFDLAEGVCLLAADAILAHAQGHPVCDAGHGRNERSASGTALAVS